MWKIFSVPCGSALYKFHCINETSVWIHVTMGYVVTIVLVFHYASTNKRIRVSL
jgi:hypothetical protein